jgi:FkbM family methyltransferase
MAMRIRDGLLALYHSALVRTGVSDQSKRIAQYHRARALPAWGLSLSRLGAPPDGIDVSIIIPSFDYAGHLPAAIGSAVNAASSNTHIKTEVIVFDDRSTDNSYDVATLLGRQSGIPFLIIRPLWNVGLVSARNIGLRHAQGKYVFLLDADNTMNADGLRLLHARAEEEQADAAYGPIRRILAEGRHEGFLSNQPFDGDFLRKRGNYIDAMALFRKSSLLRIGGYDLELLRLIGGHEDHDVWLRLAAASAHVSYCEDALVGDYLVKTDSMVHSISPREYSDGYRYMRTEISVAPVQRDDQLVFDLGFHKGEDTLNYLNAGYRVVAVEADPALYASGLAQFAESIEKKQLTLIHAAVVGWRRRQSSGTLLFHPHAANSLWGTASASFRERNEHVHGKPHEPPIEVPTTSLERLITEHGCPFLLKVDIEGLDAEVVNDLERLTVLPAYVSWETGKHSLREVMASHLRLRRLGYGRFRIAQQINVREQFQKGVSTPE